MTATTGHIGPALTRILAEREPHISGNPNLHAYASSAGSCARQIAYNLLSDPVPESSYPLSRLIAFRIGNEAHTLIQSALLACYPDARAEVRWDLGFVSGRCDGLYTVPDGRRVAVEIKSMQPWTFRRYLQAGMTPHPDTDPDDPNLPPDAYQPGTPAPEHVLQAGLSARALTCELIHIIYLNKSPKFDEPTIAEWLLATPDTLIDAELDRLRYVVALASESTIPTRFYNGDDIPDPSTQRWPCGFCDHLDRCLADGPSEQAHTPWPPPTLLSEDDVTGSPLTLTDLLLS